jgi:hypothetical protein
VEHVAAAEVIELKRADADPVILEVELDPMPSRRQRVRDPPPLKWSDLRYVFDIQEDCNGKEAIQA